MNPARLNCERSGDILVLHLSGDWRLSAHPPGAADAVAAMRAMPRPAGICFDTTGLGDWDTGLLIALIAIQREAEALDLALDASGLPDGAQRLLRLAFAVREPAGARRQRRRHGLLEQAGEATLEVLSAARELLSFTGELTLSLARFLRGHASYLRSDLAHYLQQAGADALPIVSLIAFLIGMIFAFVGVRQLEPFGAGIYTADLVGIAMVREMSAIMTAIIMAGRTGAAYAAQIGTMKVNEEIDALTTLGIDPVDFLVTPRVIALVLMLPLLSLYASLMGITGGLAVGLLMLDVSLPQYVQQTFNAVGLNALFGGLFKALVFGALVAMAGCQQGLACGNSAMAVGLATTRAVVLGIVLIVVAAAVLTVIYVNLGI
ncbi:MAG: ABC transporter permease [Gammaproteobacteria bacterium]|nr:MAG: ABC transporter permease [Gammaproteobacteria bacterium]